MPIWQNSTQRENIRWQSQSAHHHSFLSRSGVCNKMLRGRRYQRNRYRSKVGKDPRCWSYRCRSARRNSCNRFWLRPAGGVSISLKHLRSIAPLPPQRTIASIELKSHDLVYLGPRNGENVFKDHCKKWFTSLKPNKIFFLLLSFN